MKRIEQFFQNGTFISPHILGVTVFAIIFSFLSWSISYHAGVTTSYNDAMSHLNLSRMVIDNLHPGLAQIGGVWLPLNHIFTLAFVWNNWAWHSGFAGSIVSMLSYILSILFIYKTIHFVLKEKFPAVIGSAVFALNLNMLYLQSTPLTEPLFLVIFIISFYYFTRWVIERNYKDFVFFALTGFFLVLSRYDGWFVVVIETLLLGLNEIRYQKKNFLGIVGTVTIAVIPALYGILLWLLWNKLIFGNIFFFALGPYSAHAQQAALAHKTGLITKGNMWISLKAYFYAAMDNIGIIPLGIGLLSMILFFIQDNKLAFFKKCLIFLFLTTPILFNVLALYFGFSIINVPELHWSPTNDPIGRWFNVRYGILALPLVAIIIGLGMKKHKLPGAIVLFSIIVQAVLIFPNDIITLQDGIHGSSSFLNNDIATYLKTNVSQKDKVLLSVSFFNPVVFRSNIDFTQVIHEGVNTLWAKSLKYPYKGPTWIVMSNGSVGDPVYNALVTSQKNNFLIFYKLAYKGVNANVYKKRVNNEYFVRRENEKLLIGDNEFTSTEFDSYTLAYKSEADIKKEFDNFENMHINTIRFWAFGDGNTDGFQPTAGITNEQRLRTMDLILNLAREHNMRVIPVLVNNWSDFGGKAQYVKWIGEHSDDKFYTNIFAKNLFKNYVNKLVSRKNIYTGTEYRNDPTILAWDIMNEPRTHDNSFNNDILHSWATEMSEFIKQIDTNHLVLLSTENVVTEAKTSLKPLCAIDTIDICSAHMYIHSTISAQDNSIKTITDYLQTQYDAANALQKPIFIDEYANQNSPDNPGAQNDSQNSYKT